MSELMEAAEQVLVAFLDEAAEGPVEYEVDASPLVETVEGVEPVIWEGIVEGTVGTTPV